MSGPASGYASVGTAPRARDPLPLFTLPNTHGRDVRLWDFKQRRPIVLLFIHGPQCTRCREALAALATRANDLNDLHAAVLVIAHDSMDRLARLREDMRLPFTFLSDADGSVAARYIPARMRTDGSRATALFVADRYGECGLAATAAEATDLPDAAAILAEIAHGDEDTCACLVPAWPVNPDA